MDSVLHLPQQVIPLSLDGSESLTFDTGGSSGWACYTSPAVTAVGALAYVRFGPETTAPDAPIDVRELRVAANDFNSPLLRTIPIRRMVAAVNYPEHAETIRPYLSIANHVYDGGAPGSNEGLSSWSFGPAPNASTKLKRPRLKLRAPDERRMPDEFYRRVAETYLAQSIISNRAARDIAEANELAPTTVHRWIKEAKARGVLRLPTNEERS